MRATYLLLIVVFLCTTTSATYAHSKKAEEKSQHAKTKKHHSKKSHTKKQAAALKAQQKAEAKAAKLKAKQEREAAKEARRSVPRTSYKMAMRESLNNGLILSSVYRIKNVKTSASGVASAELEVRDSLDNILRTESCAATAELPTEIKADDYRLKCSINQKNHFHARLQVLNVTPGVYIGTGRNTTDIPDVGQYPIGYGAVALMAEAPPETGVPLDCVMSEWTEFSVCEGSLQTRTRTILVNPENGGLACGPTQETQFCF